MATDPRKELIQGVIVSLIRDSARMANQATEVTGRDPWRSSMMRLLELESDDAMMRANLRQVDLQLLRLEGQLDVYATLLEDRAMPTPHPQGRRASR